MNAKYCPEIKSRWKCYSTYKFILWAWMMNEIALVFAPVDMSHNGYYIHSIFHVIAAIIMGIPLVYSEICVSQYTNCNVITMWDFFPLFRSVSYVVGMCVEIKKYHNNSNVLGIFFPTEHWGPQDRVLFRSRKMFVPEIMTREFLYRQVRIRGYGRSKKVVEDQSDKTSEEPFIEKMEWSALTSN
ncbi:uncharacterized protein LOC123694738 [Colias croceus]|uniref:uncharacterized protein LOC123694738 n=1 Tax=Colias crocea TaxID=72248 RepID=UPI001E27E59A|nr:uncharacterized protein LOC123694738 [Colias croceus]